MSPKSNQGKSTRKRPAAKKQVKSTKHTESKRTNIPTSQNRSRLKQKKIPVIKYPRNPDLDPQLVWQGKDESNFHDLEAPSLPIYIQEKIDPKAIIKNLQKSAEATDPAQKLFSDFDGLDAAKQTEFYEHSANWSNRMILGDSLLVMNSLAEREGLKGKVQVIYMDPPYGIKFNSNWQVSTRNRKPKDGRDATRQPEQIRAYRDTWQNGIHSYLDYMRDRLIVARELLHTSGSIFVQIGDENVHLVRLLLDEVMGSNNFRSLITFRRAGSYGTSVGMENINNYIIWYARDIESIKQRTLYVERNSDNYNQIEMPDGIIRSITKKERENNSLLPQESRICIKADLNAQSYSPSLDYAFEFEGTKYRPRKGSAWMVSKSGMRKMELANRIQPAGKTLGYTRFLDEAPGNPISNLWNDTAGGTGATYVVQTSVRPIERCILMASDPGDLVLDPTCGSGTTAYAAEKWGRRWINIDTSRVAIALARNRLMSSKYSYYKLNDAHSCDIAQGFIYETEPQVTLKTITRNQNLVPGLTRTDIHKILIENAEKVELTNRPKEDNKIVRVSGHFTVESLSPHRPLESATNLGAKHTAQLNPNNPHFIETILFNLKKAGIQNTYANERIEFQGIEPNPSTEEQQALAAIGHYIDKSGTDRTAQITIGPEHSTVSPELIESAFYTAFSNESSDTSREKHDILAILGFAFEAECSQRAKKLIEQNPKGPQILLTKINPDLTMSDSLLKKTGAGNLFMVFGDPEIEIRKVNQPSASPPDNDSSNTTTQFWEVEIKGLDVYDPMTGEIRSSTTDDIACWFIDTNYDGNSFFVRHAYFLGARDDYKQLKTALKAEINKETWSTLHSTTSQPFLTPETGKIAIKVINHYGDEVLQTYNLPN